ncbi:hypothetical protein K6W36_09080 [Acetobacter senegalensis]|nr:hypothetical protein [Acetobacter senegalensis]
MKPHNATPTPAASACHSDAVRLARAQSSHWFSCLLFLGRLHVVMGFARASCAVLRTAARIKRLPPFAWLQEPYLQWKRVKAATEWQRDLDEAWPRYHAAYQRLRAVDISYPPLSRKAPRIGADLLDGSAR